MDDAVEDIGQEFLAEAEAEAFAESGGDVWTDHNLAVGEGKNIGGGGIAQMAVMEPAAFAGGDQNDA